MTQANYPSPVPAYRRADLAVHVVGLVLILVAGGTLIAKALDVLAGSLVAALVVYVLCAMASNLASCAYHFSAFHDRRKWLRRIDHAAIYPSISGTFTPLFIYADTGVTWTLLGISWVLTLLGMWDKISANQVQSRWSTASYLGLGAVGLCALPDLAGVPPATLWCIICGALAYVVGVCFYARRTMPYRYAIWHTWVNIGGIAMFAGIWLALF